MNIALMFGGRSAEYEVSQISVTSIYKNLDHDLHDVYLIGIDKNGSVHHYDGPVESVENGSWVDKVTDNRVVFYDNKLKPGIYEEDQLIAGFDLFFPVLHGPYGEDGRLQGLLEMSNVPYVGCGVLASAAAMDKEIAKKIFSYEGINQVPHIYFDIYDEINDKVKLAEQELGYPCFVKPANMGSSVGITKAVDEKSLRVAIEKAFRYDYKLVVEKGIDAREIEVSVLGNQNDIRVSCAGEIIPSDEFYDYDAKYKSNSSQLIIPANIKEDQHQEIKDMAKRAYKAINAEGLSRIDFFIDKDTDTTYLNEINTMPGFTSISMYPKLWENTGIGYKELLEELIKLALDRFKRDREFYTEI